MRNKFLLLAIAFLLLANALPSYAQSSNNEDGVVKIERYNQHAYRPDEVIVLFRGNGPVRMSASSKSKFSTTQVNAVDNMFRALGVDSVEELMPLTGARPIPQRIRTYSGQYIEPKNLGKLYRLKITNNQRDIFHIIDTLKTLQEVEYAEPNYLVFALSSGVGDSAVYVNEPLYSQQWGLSVINLPFLWNMPKVRTKRPVIAILDTGVDIDHPDLQANIWTNPLEENGLDDQDDDDNGFVDDVHGWDFINQTGNMNDFNGHGTHCAGIAAAVGNNGIGITGANPDAYIMPIAVLQSNGSGDVATIIRGIDYAAANGADVISMSFGGYSYSQLEEQALGRAYTTSVLVAAAGNDGLKNVEMYPAGLSFVLGVEASDETLSKAIYSNEDADGPIYTEYPEEMLNNYELRAPGSHIYSTFPGGRYKSLSGTSMACPMVAGAVSRLIQCKTDSDLVSKEVLFGDLIHSRPNLEGNIDMKTAYNCNNSNRTPTLWLVNNTMVDSLGDNDGRYDAGDTISLYPTLRNDWGSAENIKMWMKTGFYNSGEWIWDDTTLVTYLTDTVAFGKTLSSYAKNKSLNPIRFAISPNCVDGRNINLTLFAACDNCSDTLKQYFTIPVENGVEIGGMITEDLTLYPNVHYIVTQNLAIPQGKTLTIMPGTVLKFKDNTGISIVGVNKDVNIIREAPGVAYYDTYYIPDTIQSGHIIAKGTKDSMIIFEPADLAQGNYSLNLGYSFTYFEDNEYNHYDSYKDMIEDMINSPEWGKYFDFNLLEYVEIRNIRRSIYGGNDGIQNGGFKNCIIKDCENSWPAQNFIISTSGNYFDHCVIDNIITMGKFFYQMSSSNILQHTNFTNIISTEDESNISNTSGPTPLGSELPAVFSSNIFPIYFQNAGEYCIDYKYSPSPLIYSLCPNYYSSGRQDIIKKYFWDIDDNHGFGYFDTSNALTRPDGEAHGLVWKVLVDGYDAQDEFDSIPPIGVGEHECKIYFNRAMDVDTKPFISFGVRSPYTQNTIDNEGSWSADSTVYTTTFTINEKTASDGLNRFYIADARDNEHFEIPLENKRFNMQIEAAGSMSTGLMATPGLGKITLTWNTDEEDYADLMGYNIYRWSTDTIRWNRHYDYSCECYIEAGWRVDTILVNTSLIEPTDSMLVDYDVQPGISYFYIIKQVNTDLSNNSISNVVVASPLSSIKGDANGSMNVDVADVVTTVGYLTGQDPQPFIYEAADVNSDDAVNILDIVGIINIIMNPDATSASVSDPSPAYYYISNDTLYLETSEALAGVQFAFKSSRGARFSALEALNGFEQITNWTNDSLFMFMAYSLSGKTFGVGTHALLTIDNIAELSEIILSDTKGRSVAAIEKIPTGLTNIENVQMQYPYPNPFNDEVVIPYVIGVSGGADVVFVVTDITGRMIEMIPQNGTYGNNTLVWHSGNIMKGVYFVSLYIDGKLIQTHKLIRQ